MGPSSTYSKLIYLIGMGYKGRISSRFTFVHKGILIITYDCIRVSDLGLWIGLID